jgi:hypothetical protein
MSQPINDDTAIEDRINKELEEIDSNINELLAQAKDSIPKTAPDPSVTDIDLFSYWFLPGIKLAAEVLLLKENKRKLVLLNENLKLRNQAFDSYCECVDMQIAQGKTPHSDEAEKQDPVSYQTGRASVFPGPGQSKDVRVKLATYWGVPSLKHEGGEDYLEKGKLLFRGVPVSLVGVGAQKCMGHGCGDGYTQSGLCEEDGTVIIPSGFFIINITTD